MFTRILAGLVVVVGTSGSTLSTASAQSEIEVGVLTCSVESGVGFVFGSTRDVSCTFDHADGERDERYAGSIERFGLDLGITGKQTVVWAVIAPTTDLGKGSLDGRYAGVSASASLGVGLGSRVLVGGSSDTITLQPISVQAQTGVNVAITVGELTLRSTGFSTNTTTTERRVRYRTCGSTVVLAAGDTLGEIAARCGTSVDAILEDNPKINNVREIANGTTIVVPDDGITDTGSRCGSHALVKSGEGLFDIAKRCRVSIGALVNVNRTADHMGPLAEGKTINIPVYRTTISQRSCRRNVRVRSGDTLNEIGERCGVRVDALLDANPHIKNVRELEIGELVAIPAYPRARRNTACGTHAIVRTGETLSTIANRCRVSVGSILDVNRRIRTLNKLEAGRTIDLPRYSIPAVAG